MAKVDWLHNPEDLEAALLGALGFSTNYIKSRTDFTYCQVLYRLHKAGIRRLDYRNGESDEAATVLQAVRGRVKRTLSDRLVKPNPRKHRRAVSA